MTWVRHKICPLRRTQWTFTLTEFLSNWATDLGATTFAGESWHYELETVNDELIHSTMKTWFSNNRQPNKYLHAHQLDNVYQVNSCRKTHSATSQKERSRNNMKLELRQRICPLRRNTWANL